MKIKLNFKLVDIYISLWYNKHIKKDGEIWQI